MASPRLQVALTAGRNRKRRPSPRDDERHRRRIGDRQARSKVHERRNTSAPRASKMSGDRGARVSSRSPGRTYPGRREQRAINDPGRELRSGAMEEGEFGRGELSRYSDLVGRGGAVERSRGRLIDEMGVNPLARAGEAQNFLAQSARGMAKDLMPELERGLRSARSRFTGGADRSGGAQEREELAYERLFADPLQNRIAQLASGSLDYGQREAQRGVENTFGLSRLDLSRAEQAARTGSASRNRYLSALEGESAREQQQRQFEAEEKRRRLEGAGNFITGLVDAIVPF